MFGENSEIDNFLTEWLDHVFNNRKLYIIQQEDDRTFLAQVLHCTNQSIHLCLDSRSKSYQSNVRDQLLNHEEKRNLIEQQNFTRILFAAIKSIFNSSNKENEKDLDDNKKKG